MSKQCLGELITPDDSWTSVPAAWRQFSCVKCCSGLAAGSSSAAHASICHCDLVRLLITMLDMQPRYVFNMLGVCWASSAGWSL